MLQPGLTYHALFNRFSSRYDDGLMAVVKFAYQEPENDPKHYGYLWVTRGPQLTEPM